MTTRATAPAGAPCWTDLWTSDVEGSRRFYADVFGWQAEEPSEEFGGYFMFTRDGAPVASAPVMTAESGCRVRRLSKSAHETLSFVHSLGSQALRPRPVRAVPRLPPWQMAAR